MYGLENQSMWQEIDSGNGNWPHFSCIGNSFVWSGAEPVFPSCTGKELFYSRYEMTGSDQEGDYTLNIFPVHLEDDAVFQCQVISYFRIFFPPKWKCSRLVFNPQKKVWWWDSWEIKMCIENEWANFTTFVVKN